MPPAINRETVSGEALFILRSLRENSRHGRSNKLADVKAALEPSCSLDFDRYFFFLRKFHYIAMDREAQLKLTDQGEKAVDGDAPDRFAKEVGEFFKDHLLPDETTSQGEVPGVPFPEIPPVAVPPPPPEDLDLAPAAHDIPLEEPPMASVPPSKARKPASAGDEPFASPPPMPQVTAPPPSQPFGSAASKASAGDAEGRYQRFDPIGAGPLGNVFKGRQNALGLDVCVKELKDIFGYFSFLQRSEVIKRLKKELCAQAAVRHPSVVSILDHAIDGPRPFFVVELCKGSLRERLDQAQGKGLPVVPTLRTFLQVAYGLRAAHQQGLVHHNLKPENVLYDGYGNAKVADFGMTRVIEVDQAKGMPQVFVGTGGMPYLAPELLNRSKDAGQSADVYALGILLYEMLTGQVPGRRSPMPSETNNEIPSKVDPIFDKMTQDRREARYPDFDAVLTDFYGAFSDGEFLGKGDLVLFSELPK